MDKHPSIENNNRQGYGGFSLVELLIAMTLGLILLTGMLAVFSGNKRSSDLNTAMANIQENARFALSALSRDVRISGYQGCLDPVQGNVFVNSVDSPVLQEGWNTDGSPQHNILLTSTTGAVVQNEALWSPALSGGFVPPVTNPAIPGTHVLSVQYGTQSDTALAGAITLAGISNPSGPIITESNLGFEAGDLAIIASCDSADLFTVSTAAPFNDGQILQHAAPLNTDGSLSYPSYGDQRNLRLTRVMHFRSQIYYIGDTGLTNESGDQIRALYQQSYPYNDPLNPPSELAQGVENMRLSFGMDTTDGIRYVSADDPEYDPLNVASVQIGLIMTSWDRIAEQDDTNTYTVAGQAIPSSSTSVDGLTHAEDRRFRLVFNTTVKVRNRRGSK